MGQGKTQELSNKNTTDKPFRTVSQQIEILKSRKLIISNEEYAKHFLSRHSYYDVINGYKDCFLDQNTKEETFLEGTTFEEIVALYKFDKNMRNVVISAISDAESILQCALALSVGETYGENEKEYLRDINFTKGRYYKNHSGEIYTQRDRLLRNMNKICKSDEEPMHHYRVDHHNIPPWILVEGMNLGNYCIYYELSHQVIKDKIISKVTNIDVSDIDKTEKEFFRKSLDILRRFRNRAAHGRRIFNYKCNEELTYIESIHGKIGISKSEFNEGAGKNDFLALLITLSHIYRRDRKAFFDNLCLFFNIYAENYYKEDPDNFYKILYTMLINDKAIKLYFPELKKKVD